MPAKICIAFLLFLALPISAEATQFGRTTSQVNLRAGPSRTSRIIGVLAQETEVAILREDPGGWYLVIYQGRPGFVHKGYVELQHQNPARRFEWKSSHLAKPAGVILVSLGVILIVYVLAPFLLTTAIVLAGSLITVVVLDLYFQLGALYSLFSVSLGLLLAVLFLARKNRSRTPSPNKASPITRKAA